MNEIAQRIKAHRSALGLSEAKFSRLFGISQSTLKRYEKGERVPRADFMAAIFGAGEQASEVFAEGTQVVISHEADFEQLTWTFRITKDTKVGAGRYALTWLGPNAEITGDEAGRPKASG